MIENQELLVLYSYKYSVTRTRQRFGNPISISKLEMFCFPIALPEQVRMLPSGSLASALSTKNVGHIVLEGLVEHTLRGSMNVPERGVSRHSLEKYAPLVPSVAVYPFLPIEQVNPLEYSVEEEHVVSDDHALRSLRRGLCACRPVCSRHLQG